MENKLTFKQVVTQFPALREVLELIYLDNGGTRLCPFEDLDYPVEHGSLHDFAIADKFIGMLTPKQRELFAMDPEELHDAPIVTIKVEPIIAPFFDGESSMFVKRH